MFEVVEISLCPNHSWISFRLTPLAYNKLAQLWRLWGAPHKRHSRAMHLYQSGIPLSYIKDFLGHVSSTTTSIYAYADTSMIKDALEKAASKGNATSELPIWEGDEDMILKLCGLR